MTTRTCSGAGPPESEARRTAFARFGDMRTRRLHWVRPLRPPIAPTHRSSFCGSGSTICRPRRTIAGLCGSGELEVIPADRNENFGGSPGARSCRHARLRSMRACVRDLATNLVVVRTRCPVAASPQQTPPTISRTRRAGVRTVHSRSGVDIRWLSRMRCYNKSLSRTALRPLDSSRDTVGAAGYFSRYPITPVVSSGLVAEQDREQNPGHGKSR
jgi:hypothetical protein